jgi:RimJ/RimL family protein N-acetyltransferase
VTTLPIIETERLILRAPDIRDVEVCANFNETDRSKWSGGPRDAGQSWRGLASLIGHWHLRGFGMFALQSKSGDDAALGIVGPWAPDGWPEPELGWHLWSAQLEGKGLAFEAASAIRNWAYASQNWTTLVSYIDPQNTRSIALAERLDATIDPKAPHPFSDSPETRVYRHPAPEALQ